MPALKGNENRNEAREFEKAGRESTATQQRRSVLEVSAIFLQQDHVLLCTSHDMISERHGTQFRDVV